MNGQTTVLLSGGIDSMACAYYLMKQKHKIRTLFVDYGQAALSQEQKASKSIAECFGWPIFSAAIVTDSAHESGEILGRNAALILVALMGLSEKSSYIATGIHDGTEYYDCSSHFYRRISPIVSEYTDGKVELLAPFLNWQKKDIFEFAKQESLPIELAYSCECGTTVPCGSCLSCKDREELNC